MYLLFMNKETLKKISLIFFFYLKVFQKWLLESNTSKWIFIEFLDMIKKVFLKISFQVYFSFFFL